MANILLAGCGAIGRELGVQLVQQGHQVWGMRRSNIKLPFNLIQADFSQPMDAGLLPATMEYVVHTASPSERSDLGYKHAYCDGLSNLLALLDPKSLKRFFFVSSTAVYHQDDGSWVDESSPTEPERFNGKRLLQAEQLLQQSAFNGTSIRFGGIYGSGRSRLINRVKAGVEVQAQPPKYTNRIHQQDCVSMLAFLIAQDLSGHTPAPCYIGVDDDPASEASVYQWLAQQLDAPAPTVITAAAGGKQNKRCSNQLIKQTGFNFLYPSYQDGYRAELADH